MSTKLIPLSSAAERAALRLSALSELNLDEVERIREAATIAHRIAPHREIVTEGEAVVAPSIVLAGWACRVRIFSDGRRQILSFLLPGDLIGMCAQREPLAATTITALTEVALCPAPPSDGDSGLAHAYAVSGALEQFYLFRQIARLGRLSAYDRMLDWMLEMRERLALAGLASVDSFPLPLTQECLADALGLTSVHVNRTLQVLRREGALDMRSGTTWLQDPDRLARQVDYRPAIVSGRPTR